MLTIFLVGPYRGESHARVKDNIERAALAARCCWIQGLAVVCPHLNSQWFSGICDEEIFLNGYREILRRCDAVLTVDGWADSSGALLELETAKLHGIPIFHSILDLVTWGQPSKSTELHTPKS